MSRHPLAPTVTTAPSCCGRDMSTISVTETGSGTVSELSLLSCSSCSRHAWLQDGVLLDRDGMLAAVRARLAEAPRPKGGRPKGSGTKRRPPSPPAVPVEDDAARRAREMRALLSGFTVHGTARH